MAGPLSPFFKSPITDITGVLISHQWFGKCQELEEKALDCMEAYGLIRGERECKPLLNDLKECTLQKKQFARFSAMVEERDRQIKAGEKTKEQLLTKSPTPDSY